MHPLFHPRTHPLVSIFGKMRRSNSWLQTIWSGWQILYFFAQCEMCVFRDATVHSKSDCLLQVYTCAPNATTRCSPAAPSLNTRLLGRLSQKPSETTASPRWWRLWLPTRYVWSQWISAMMHFKWNGSGRIVIGVHGTIAGPLRQVWQRARTRVCKWWAARRSLTLLNLQPLAQVCP